MTIFFYLDIINVNKSHKEWNIMSNEETNTPDVDQEVKKTAKKSKEGYNGIYRRNTRVKKKASAEEQSNVSEEQVNVAETEVSTEIQAKNETIVVDEQKEDLQPKKRLTTKKKTSPSNKVTTEKDTNPTVEDNEKVNETKENLNKQENEKEDAPVVTVRSPFHELLYLIRQKNAYNHTEFFFELEKVLLTMKFDEIKESNLSLFGFACMYDRETIFHKLCEEYSDFIKQEDLESILKICFTKREETVGNLIKVYSERFTPSSEFIKDLFNSMSISSYRENNNIQILEWVAPYLTEDEYEVFWNKCIEHRNISLMNTAFHVPSIKENLQRNFSKYLDGFKLIGREHTFSRALNRDYRKINPQGTVETKDELNNDNENINAIVSFKTPKKEFKGT